MVSATRPEDTFRIIEDSVFDLWNVIDDLSRIHPPKTPFYRVTIFGSARVKPGEQLYEDVRRLSSLLAAMGCDIITGGGPGLMQAANEGERLGDASNTTRSIGLRIELAFEQEANPFVEKLFRHRTFFSRLHHFVRLSSAFVVMPGGIGTSLELMLVWQLLQVRHMYGTPLILVGDMWRDLVEWTKTHMIDGATAYINPEDAEIPICVDTIDEAVEIIGKHKRQWPTAP